MDWKKELGRAIFTARDSANGGMTQDQLAKAAHLARNSIVNYENGRRAPDLDQLRRIAEALGRDHFDIGEGFRVEFSSNGTHPSESAPQQLPLEFDQQNGVSIRIEPFARGIIIKKISA